MSNIEDMEIIDSLRKLLKEEPSINDISIYKQQWKDGTADVRCEICNQIMNRFKLKRHCGTSKKHKEAIRILNGEEEEVFQERAEKERQRREKKREYNKTYDKSGWQQYRIDLFYKYN